MEAAAWTPAFGMTIAPPESDCAAEIGRARAAGAAGYLTKDRTTDELTDALFGPASLVAAFG